MRTVLLVMGREIDQRGRSKPFLLAFGFIMLAVTAAVLLPQVLGGGPVTWTAGALGEGSEQVLQTARTIALSRSDPDREVAVEIIGVRSQDEAERLLAEGAAELVVVDGNRILRQGSAGFSGSDLQDTVQQAAAVMGLEARLTGTGVGAEDLADLLGGAPLRVETLAGTTDPEVEETRSIVAYGGMMLMYFAILGFGSWTLQGIAEEKASRVVEVLLATLRPWQLLTGKILGIGLLGLGQFALTIGWTIALLRLTDAVDLPGLGLDSAVTLVGWFVLGYAVYAVLFATAGALVSRMEDAQTAAFPITMIAVVGLIASLQVLEDPAGLPARVMTQIPVVAPFVVPIRVAYREIGAVEHVISVLVCLATLVVLVRMAGRVYANGLLRFGSRIRLRQAWRSAESR